jgi:phosphoribosylamine--glycine ligase
MNVLVVGSGGREHALCWSLAASPVVTKLYCAPGNAGIAAEAECVDLRVDDLDGLVAFALEREVGLVVVGPELPLVLGLVDRLEAAGIKAFGPSAAAARLEGSKAFTKTFCARHDIPTAAFRTFARGEAAAAEDYLRGHPLPVVVKADGLAAGKGVVIARSTEEALAAVRAAFAGAYGEAGATLVVEEFMDGEEASLFALCDGRHALEIGTARDHKRALDGDRGPNTGGMGAYSPAPTLDPATVERVMREIVRPTLAGMAAEGCPFKGVLYAGLMLTTEGPKLVEFNVRFGDPECQGRAATADDGPRRAAPWRRGRRARPHEPALVPRALRLRGDGEPRLSRPLREGHGTLRARPGRGRRRPAGLPRRYAPGD